MQVVKKNLIIAVLRKKGELNKSISNMELETGINRRTLSKIFKSENNLKVQNKTYVALNDWLINHI